MMGTIPTRIDQQEFEFVVVTEGTVRGIEEQERLPDTHFHYTQWRSVSGTSTPTESTGKGRKWSESLPEETP